MQTKLHCELLCEDEAQENFFLPILKRLFHRVRVTRGRRHGGFTFVLAQAPKSLASGRYRRREAVALLIAIDGDEMGHTARLKEVRKKLVEGGQDLEAVGDHLAICVPTRNIETWLLWLQGRRDLDEIEDYKRAVEAIGYSKETAKLWFAPGDAHLESSRLPSLAHGRKEIARLKLVSKL